MDTANSDVYVADRGNNRVDVFAASGEFLFAFGWGVQKGDESTAGLDTCTTATGCQKGFGGSSAGQFAGLQAVATDSNGDIYTYEGEGPSTANLRVQKFSASGSFISMIGGGVDKTSGGDLCTAASGDVCGAGAPGTGLGHFNDTYDSLAVSPTDELYVADSIPVGAAEAEGFIARIEVFKPDGTPTKAIELPAVSGGRLKSVAVAPAGDFYVGAGAAGPNLAVRVQKYSPTGSLLAEPVDQPLSSQGAGQVNDPILTVDAAEHLFVSAADGPSEVGTFNTLLEFSSDGTIIKRFGYGTSISGTPIHGGLINSPPIGVAASPSESGLYVSESERQIHLIPFPPAGPLVIPGATGAMPRSSRAVLNGYVNPEGSPTTAHFEYIERAVFESGGGFANPATKSTPESPTLDAGYSLEKTTAAIAGLVPETEYAIRLVSEDQEGHVIDGEAAFFTTLAPLELLGTWAGQVTDQAAHLNVEVNPLGTPATGYFEYVDQDGFERSGFTEAQAVPAIGAGAGPISLGAEEEPTRAQVEIDALSAGASYVYRFTATDHCKPDPTVTCTFVGPTMKLTTPSVLPPFTACPNQERRLGEAASLPNCRAFEMVSPVDKNNTDIESLINLNGTIARLDQSALDGNSFTYTTSQGFGDAEGVPFTSQYIATRHEGEGWSSHDITPAQGVSTMEIGNRLDLEFRVFTPNLCEAAFVHATDPPLAPGALPGYFNPYRRENCGAGALEPLFAGAVSPSVARPEELAVAVQGMATEDGCVVFRATDRLAPEAAVQPFRGWQIYERCPGDPLRLVSVLPSGLANSDGGGSSVGMENGGGGLTVVNRTAKLSGAVSSSGNRVYWTAAAEGSGTIYLRENPMQPEGSCSTGKACTLPVSERVSSQPAQFQAAASDGSRAIFTIGNPGALSLYAYEQATRGTALIAEGVTGFLGASEDASWVYFTSTKSLATGAQTGEQNLYVARRSSPSSWSITFIAVLSAEDVRNEDGKFTPVAKKPFERTSRVSPNGHQLVFASFAPLTGYDNTDAASPRPCGRTEMLNGNEVRGVCDAEIYAFDDEGGNGHLHCVSCNPTGERPTGIELEMELSKTGQSAAATLPEIETSLFASRVVTEDGSKIFFDSYDALVPRDTNGVEDVYEWQPGTSASSCESVGAEVFAAEDEGCLSLISGGQEPNDSELLDVSESGADVFFSTAQSLVASDTGLRDIYDAREGGGFVSSMPPTPCQGEACQGGQAAPSVPSTGTGAGAAGNPVGLRPSCVKPLRALKRKGKWRCVNSGKKGKKGHGKGKKGHGKGKKGHGKGKKGHGNR